GSVDDVQAGDDLLEGGHMVGLVGGDVRGQRAGAVGSLDDQGGDDRGGGGLEHVRVLEVVGGLHDPGGIAVDGHRLGAVVGDLGVLPEVGQHPGGGGVALEDGGRRGLQTRVAALVLGEGDPAQGCDAVPV